MIIQTKLNNISAISKRKYDKAYKAASNSITVRIPNIIDLFKPKDTLVVSRILEGFIIRKSTLDDRKTVTFNKNKKVTLDISVDCDNNHGEYNYEIIDSETLKLIRI